MHIIKKLIPIDIYLALSKVKHENSSVDSVALFSVFLYTFSFVHVFIGIVFYFLNTDLYFTYTKEDGYIEYFTAAFLLAISLLCFYKASYLDEQIPKVLFYTLAAVFFLGFGEEISWANGFSGLRHLMSCWR